MENLDEQNEENYMKKACKLAELGVKRGGGPFGCIIVDKTSGEIFGKGHNMVSLEQNPTLHAEMVAINDACHNLNTFDLSACALYTSCEPCPMCLAAIYWAHIGTVYYGNTKKDAANIGFDDSFIYDEMAKPMEQRAVKMTQIGAKNAAIAFEEWTNKSDKIRY
jgi:tRNA(Arg) A34 adenosine deaminase TadA